MMPVYGNTRVELKRQATAIVTTDEAHAGFSSIFVVTKFYICPLFLSQTKHVFPALTTYFFTGVVVSAILEVLKWLC